MTLTGFWFLVIAILWTGYFFLEGFDFGVGILMPFVSKDDLDRRVVINTIGPVWDGNEVWLLVAGGATFAAFPEWYATLFSGFYLALFLILAALIARGVAFEYRGKGKGGQWSAWWDRALFFGSALPALLWGVAFANIVRGVPLNSQHEFTGTLFTLLKPYALVGGLTSLLLFTVHGGVYLTLKTTGEIRERTRRIVQRYLVPPTIVSVFGFLAWTYLNARHYDHRGLVPPIVPIAAVGLVLVVGWLLTEKLDAWAFVATGLAIVLITATLFLNLYPRVLPSTTNADFSLTVTNAASSAKTLRVMTVVAVIFTPIVLAYQGWSLWVFRKRLSRPGQQAAPVRTGSPSGDGPAGGTGTVPQTG